MSHGPVAIIGGGQFGVRALKWARSSQYPAVVFDASDRALATSQVDRVVPVGEAWTPEDLLAAPSILVLGDVNECVPLLERLQPEIIFPTVPLHFLATALLFVARLEDRDYRPDGEGIENVARQLPADLNISVTPEAGMLTLSYALPGELCPPNCVGPTLYCPRFCRNKPATVTQIVAGVAQDMPDSFLAESQQITAGLGGIMGMDFFRLLDKLRNTFPLRFLAATTCNCHGVVHAFDCNG